MSKSWPNAETKASRKPQQRDDAGGSPTPYALRMSYFPSDASPPEAQAYVGGAARLQSRIGEPGQAIAAQAWTFGMNRAPRFPAAPPNSVRPKKNALRRPSQCSRRLHALVLIFWAIFNVGAGAGCGPNVDRQCHTCKADMWELSTD